MNVVQRAARRVVRREGSRAVIEIETVVIPRPDQRASLAPLAAEVRVVVLSASTNPPQPHPPWPRKEREEVSRAQGLAEVVRGGLRRCNF